MLGGGYSGPLIDASISYDYPIANGTAWDVSIVNYASITESFTPYAICAS